MELKATIVEFNGQSLELVKLEGRRCFTSEDVGRALGYNEPRIAINKIFNRNRDEFRHGIDYTVTKLVTVTGEKESIVFYLKGAILISLLSKQPIAKEFRVWARDILSLDEVWGSSPDEIGMLLKKAVANYQDAQKKLLESEDHFRKIIGSQSDRIVDFLIERYMGGPMGFIKARRIWWLKQKYSFKFIAEKMKISSGTASRYAKLYKNYLDMSWAQRDQERDHYYDDASIFDLFHAYQKAGMVEEWNDLIERIVVNDPVLWFPNQVIKRYKQSAGVGHESG